MANIMAPSEADSVSFDTRDEAMAAIRALIDRIVVTPEDDELRVDLHGELATILQFASAKQKPAAEVRDGLPQFKLVAGARYQPFRTPVSAFVPIPE